LLSLSFLFRQKERESDIFLARISLIADEENARQVSDRAAEAFPSPAFPCVQKRHPVQADAIKGGDQGLIFCENSRSTGGGYRPCQTVLRKRRKLVLIAVSPFRVVQVQEQRRPRSRPEGRLLFLTCIDPLALSLSFSRSLALSAGSRSAGAKTSFHYRGQMSVGPRPPHLDVFTQWLTSGDKRRSTKSPNAANASSFYRSAIFARILASNLATFWHCF